MKIKKKKNLLSMQPKPKDLLFANDFLQNRREAFIVSPHFFYMHKERIFVAFLSPSCIPSKTSACPLSSQECRGRAV